MQIDLDDHLHQKTAEGNLTFFLLPVTFSIGVREISERLEKKPIRPLSGLQSVKKTENLQFLDFSQDLSLKHRRKKGGISLRTIRSFRLLAVNQRLIGTS